MKTNTERKNANYLEKFSTLLSVFVFFLVWEILARVTNAPLVLPLPLDVFRTFTSMASTLFFWQNVAATFLRVCVAFAFSVFVGTLIGFLCGTSVFLKNFFEFPLAVIRATPVVAFILIAFFWFRSNTIPIVVSVLMSLPVIASNITTGFSKKNKMLSDMANVFQLSKIQQFKHITVPAVRPYFFNGSISCFGLSWKVVTAGEVLSLPRYGAGTLLQNAQVHLETRQVLAVTIVIVAISFLLEKFFEICATGRK